VPRVSPDGRRVAYVRDDGKGASELRVLDAVTFRTLATHHVNGGADYDWVGDTLVIAQLDFTSRWRLRSDLYRWVPTTGAWSRATHGARLVAPTGGGGGRAAIALGPGAGRPPVPVPDDSGKGVWTDLALSPDGRWAAGIRCTDGRWSLLLWPAPAPPGPGGPAHARRAAPPAPRRPRCHGSRRAAVSPTWCGHRRESSGSWRIRPGSRKCIAGPTRPPSGRCRRGRLGGRTPPP